MGYSKNALKKIIQYSKQTGSDGEYIELSDSVLNIGQFYLADAVDIYDDYMYMKFPCEKCKEFYDPNDLNPQEPHLNYCNPCIEEEESKKEKKEYFDSLRKKGLLEDYGKWIEGLYPHLYKHQ